MSRVGGEPSRYNTHDELFFFFVCKESKGGPCLVEGEPPLTCSRKMKSSSSLVSMDRAIQDLAAHA